MTALQALNKVRARTGVAMPALADLSQAAIMHERRVELGFEGQRYWDVRRWKLGGTYFNQPLNRIEITLNGSTFNYAVKKLEDRVYDDKKMNWYPIPQNEIIKTGWAQNAGW
jgi:hypothetical protein